MGGALKIVQLCHMWSPVIIFIFESVGKMHIFQNNGTFFKHNWIFVQLLECSFYEQIMQMICALFN